VVSVTLSPSQIDVGPEGVIVGTGNGRTRIVIVPMSVQPLLSVTLTV
jgi:hypothetical protein